MINDLMGDLMADSDNTSLEDIANGIQGTEQPAEAPETETATQTAAVASTAQSSDDYTLTFDRPTFSKMIGTLKIIENICNDCEICDGKIRTIANNRKSCIVIDLSSILQDKNLSFSFLRAKLNLLKTFELDMNVQAEDNNIIIQSGNGIYEFSDCFSKFVFRKPLHNFLDNTYMDDEEFAKVTAGVTDDSLIFTDTISNYLKRRLSTICDGFRVDSLKFELNGDHALLGIETKSKEDISKNTKKIPLLQNIDGQYFSLINLPFILDIQSDLKMSCYKLNGDFCMCKSELNHFGIPFTIYNKMRLVASNS